MSNSNREELDHVYNELQSVNSIYCTEEMTMLTLSIAIIGLGWQFANPVLFTLTFVILLPLQLLLNSHRDQMVRNGAYIAVFYASEEDDLKWERALKYFNLYAGKKSPLWFIARYNSAYLGMIALLSILFMWVAQTPQNPEDTYFIICFIFSLIAQICVILANSHFLFSHKIEMNYKRTFVEARILFSLESRIKGNEVDEITSLLDEEISKAVAMFSKDPRLIPSEVLNEDIICEDIKKALMC